MTLPRPGYYLGDHRILTVTDRGDRMYLDTRDIMITTGILCWGSWEPETTKSFEDVLKPGMSWADIGANVGYFTVIGHKLVRGGGRTWAFEANPSTHALLVDNMQLNWFFSDIQVENKAVYSESGRIKFHAPTKLNANASLVPLDLERVLDVSSEYDVEAVSLDDYFAHRGRRVDFLKIDIEGAEEFALRGGRRTLTENREIQLLIEWSPAQMELCGSTPQKMAALIREYGFHVTRAEGERTALDFEGLLRIQDTTMLLLRR